MDNLIIRQASLDYLEKIQKLNYELFKLEKENYDSTLVENWPLSYEGKNYFEDLIKNAYVIVALIDDKISGYLAGTSNSKGEYELVQYGEINNMFIDNRYRGIGIGNKLINQFKEYCKSNNINHLKVVASAKNTDAIEFYKKQGFSDFDVTLTMEVK